MAYPPEDFGDVGDDTNPSLAPAAWALAADEEPVTRRPATQAARPAAIRATHRHATGTPVPAPLPQAPEAPTRAARRATPSPWSGSSEVEAPTRMARRDADPRPLPPPPVQARRPATVARAASVVTPAPFEASVVTASPRRTPRATPAPHAASVATSAPHRTPRATPAPQAVSVAAPAPRPPIAPAPAAPAMVAPPQVDIPPELAAPVYGLIRRLALQTELVSADRVLRVGLAELTDATVALSRFIDEAGEPWTIEEQGDGGPSPEILAKIAAAGCQVCDGNILVQPIVAAGRTVAIIVLTRSERLAGFGLIERAIAMLVARECAGLIHQLLGAHAQKEREAAADAKSLFRAEALENHRNKGTEGALVNLSPAWVRRAYPIACALVVVALAFAWFAKVPTYSTGPVVVTVDGFDMTAPAQGTVEHIAVSANDRVKAGDELARLYSVQEKSELEQAEQDYRNALILFLVDNDDAAKQALVGASTKRQRARDLVESRTVRAAGDGVVSDVRVRPGQNLMPGDRILTIVPEGADPVVLALLPGQDRPRLRIGQTLQVALNGFIKPREQVTITEVGSEVLGPDDARRMLGSQFADMVGQAGSWVLVKARLPSRTFESQRHTYHFHNGLRGTGEVRIEAKPFLVTLLPAVEKILY
ncbi:MAG: HlyD family efflux transporter periplasmic adaptor subunit [Kofleriaceae bacterium]